MALVLHRFSNSFILILLCWFLIDEVDLFDNKVKLEVLLTRFSNPHNRNALNQCCDGRKDALNCTRSCDVFFAVCVRARCRTSSVILRNTSEFTSSHENFSLSSESFAGSSVSVNVNLRSDASFTILIYDDDSIDGSPSLGNRSSYEDIVNFSRPLPKAINSISVQNFSKNNITVEFLYRLKCGKNYYGEQCDTFCSERNDRFGHTKCLANGTRICRAGWKGDLCTTPICSPECTIPYGTCDSPGFCKCLNGWDGSLCRVCINAHKCVHGTCDHPLGPCNCEKDWTGISCDILMNYCSIYTPCVNGECFNHNEKNFTCRCYPDWDGPNCNECKFYFSEKKTIILLRTLCPRSCNRSNAECPKRNQCKCKDNWSGPDCNQCVPSSNCTHGYCVKPLECICKEGWKGENCNETTVPKSFCSQRNPCQNAGTCVDGAKGNYSCECKRGFTGRNCQFVAVVPCPKWCEESRGSCQDGKCRCNAGWKGPNCSECVRNSSCVNGFCRQPFECLCNESWTGPFCNTSKIRCSSRDNSSRCGNTVSVETEESTSDTDRIIYILSSILVVLLLSVIVCLIRRRHRRHATFNVPPSGIVANHCVVPSYTAGNGVESNGIALNNNNPSKPDLEKKKSPEIVLNPVALQPSQNSRSTLIDNGPEIYEPGCVITNEDNSLHGTKYCII
ncbi:delta-like protein C [Dendronephthya gigantea]|uniref:delta-like protein C n=1 Tax=Dendronephthya gigantea TaxID=151771 RepID=UPI00106B55C7|nr:delta-like protein C [Dendronephthya gigantea]